jgi:hypothetical protein
VAALFGWHPLRVESVAWVTERQDVLSGFFGDTWGFVRRVGSVARRQAGKPAATSANRIERAGIARRIIILTPKTVEA